MLDGSGYATDFLVQHGFDVIAVKSAKNLWYQNLSLDMLASINEYVQRLGINYQKRVAYGSSMGGYASIQFSGKLECDVVLAISPQFEIDAAYDLRWAFAAKDIVIVHRIEANALSTKCKYFVVFDPATMDELHVKRLRDLLDPTQLTELETPFSGHPSANYLAETGLIQEVALSILKHESTANLDIGARRHHSKTYFYELSKSLLGESNCADALAAIDSAIEMDGSVAEFHLQRSIVLFGMHDVNAAIESAKCARANTNNPDWLAAIAHRFRLLGNSELALEAVNKAIAVAPSRLDLLRLKIDICRDFRLWLIAASTLEHLRSYTDMDNDLLKQAIITNFRCMRLRNWRHAFRLIFILIKSKLVA